MSLILQNQVGGGEGIIQKCVLVFSITGGNNTKACPRFLRERGVV